MKKKLLALLLGSALVLAACGGGEKATESNDKTSGDEATVSVDVEKKYQQKCSMCHGVNLNDGRGNVPDLSNVGSRLSKEEIEHIILEGVGTMPGGQLKDEEASAVAEWLAAKK